jgi:hypothetical protein
MLKKEIPVPEKVCHVMKHYGVSINLETAQYIINEQGGPKELEKVRLCLWSEIGDEEETLWTLLQRNHDVNETIDMGPCEGKQFKESEGLLIDQMDGNWLNIWRELTGGNAGRRD